MPAPPHVTRLVQRLEKAGYVERVPDPGDGRAHRMRLREAGRDAVDCICAVGRRRMAEAPAGRSPEDRRSLAGLVGRMADDIAGVHLRATRRGSHSVVEIGFRERARRP
ncbi:MarR family winged helix-turn-helix transcriptional regulator [Spirillospora sp. CA-255316]